MARGWESKAVADQMEQADMRAEARADFEASLEVRARRERLESLRLSRARTLERLDRPLTRVHRDMLQRTLDALEREMEELV